jgi:(p)ppGpp synthase/HD superfamily hydrolase
MSWELSDAYRDALGYAFDLHRTQRRAGSGVPYVAHVLGVSSLTIEYGGDEAQAIAALLHDAAEDQGGETVLATIEQRFGERVTRIVRACTDALETPKPPWKTRKVRYLEHLRTSTADVQLVAACDKLYNLRCIVNDYRIVGEELWARFSGGRDGVLWYYAELARCFTLSNPVVAELERTVQQLEHLLAGA